MKNKNNQLERLENVITQDRMVLNDNFYNLFVSDLNNMLSDYFEFNDKPLVNFYKVGNKYSLEIKLDARRLLSFGVLPKD